MTRAEFTISYAETIGCRIQGAHVHEVDCGLIERWKKGDKRAFGEIVRLYMSDAFYTALGFTGNEEDAKDLSQEAFIKAYQARDSFDPERPFYPWFYRILKNHCLNFLKRFRKPTVELHYPDQPDRERFASPIPTPLEQLEEGEQQKMLFAAVGRLSIEHREIIILKNFKGYSYQEIADILNIPIGTVMSRLYYARKMIKEMVHEFEKTGIPEGQHFTTDETPSPGEVG
jgi:RNA polymerase sigma-70 factor (ECF subfamily)